MNMEKQSAGYIQVTDVSIFNKEDWPQLISFFKQRMIALDQFWSMAQYGFDELQIEIKY
jgi:hypothetical protein